MSDSPIRRRRRLLPTETDLLRAVFEHYPRPNNAMRHLLADRLGMSPRAVQIWFQNRRAKVKRDLMESGRTMLLFAPTYVTAPPPLSLESHHHTHHNNGHFLPGHSLNVMAEPPSPSTFPPDQDSSPVSYVDYEDSLVSPEGRMDDLLYTLSTTNIATSTTGDSSSSSSSTNTATATSTSTTTTPTDSSGGSFEFLMQEMLGLSDTLSTLPSDSPVDLFSLSTRESSHPVTK